MSRVNMNIRHIATERVAPVPPTPPNSPNPHASQRGEREAKPFPKKLQLLAACNLEPSSAVGWQWPVASGRSGDWLSTLQPMHSGRHACELHVISLRPRQTSVVRMIWHVSIHTPIQRTQHRNPAGKTAAQVRQKASSPALGVTTKFWWSSRRSGNNFPGPR
jgi:hypothetical protein